MTLTNVLVILLILALPPLLVIGFGKILDLVNAEVMK